MDAIDGLGALPHDGLAGAYQVAQIADGLGRNEAGFEQAMAQQVSKPLTVFDVGLVTRDGLHVLGIDQDHLDGAFQHIEDGTPVDPGRLHGYVRHPQPAEPVTHAVQLGGGRRKGAHLLADLAGGSGEQHTGHHGLLVDIESGTTGIQDAQTHCHVLSVLLY